MYSVPGGALSEVVSDRCPIPGDQAGVIGPELPTPQTREANDCEMCAPHSLLRLRAQLPPEAGPDQDELAKPPRSR